MRTFGTFTLAAVLAFTVAACGSKSAPTPGDATGAAKGFAEGMKDLAKSMEDMGKGGDGKTYQPVDFKALQAFFPDLNGWEKGETSGETMTAPFAHSTAKVSYSKGDASIEIEIIDSAFSKLALLPFQMMLGTGYAKESSNGYEKTTKIGGYPGVEKWEKDSKHAELTAIVAGRFIVSVQGNQVESPSGLAEVMGKLDLGKLAGVK
jgi:hypothetical protein